MNDVLKPVVLMLTASSSSLCGAMICILLDVSDKVIGITIWCSGLVGVVAGIFLANYIYSVVKRIRRRMRVNDIKTIRKSLNI